MHPYRRVPIVPALLLAVVATAASLTAGRAHAGAPARRGTIEGRILHPARPIPAMRICAFGEGAPERARRTCVRTRAGQDRYRIAGLVPGTYTVFARAADATLPVGAHVLPVRCIRAPCPDMPAAVSVTAGGRTTDVDLNGFYDGRDDFPPLPRN